MKTPYGELNEGDVYLRADALDERDYCTDPDNCSRCKAATWDQPNRFHAGIPVGPQRTAEKRNSADGVAPTTKG